MSGATAARGGGEQDRRDQVVLAAVAAVEELGPGVGLGEVAARSGIQRPNLYRLFTSKEQLDAEVARYAGAQLNAAVRPHLSERGTMAQLVAGVIGAGVAWADEHPQLYRLLATQHHRSSGVRIGWDRLLGEFVGAIQSYLAAGGMRAEVPSGVLASLMGLVDAGIVWWLDHRDETQSAVAVRLSRHVTRILGDVAEELGLDIPTDLVLSPRPGVGAGL